MASTVLFVRMVMAVFSWAAFISGVVVDLGTMYQGQVHIL
jgi:hypothetical protein